MTATEFDAFRAKLRNAVTITDLLESLGHHLRRGANGSATTRCPFHDDHRPSLSVFVDKEGTERFRCFGCNAHGDVFDFAQLQSGDPDHLSTLRRLADEHHIPWPAALTDTSHKHADIIQRAARFYQRAMTPQVIEYLAGRGFPEAFVRERGIGFAPVGTAGTQTRLADEARKAKCLDEAIAAGLVITKQGRMRDFFWSDLRGYIIFPNLVDGTAVGLQGRAFPDAGSARAKYLNLPGSTHQLYNPRGAAFAQVIIAEGIPDAMSAMLAQIPDTGVCGLFGTQGWQDDWLRLFRRTKLVYVALDRDAEAEAIALARAFGTRGRVIVPPAELGPKGDLNDWLCGPAGRDPATFRELLREAMRTSLTPYAMLADRIPPDLARWDLERAVLLPATQRTGGAYTGQDLLRELGHFDPVFRDSHLLRIAERIGLPFATLQEAALGLARENGQ